MCIIIMIFFEFISAEQHTEAKKNYILTWSDGNDVLRRIIFTGFRPLRLPELST